MDGLDISEQQFIKMKPAERDLLIYRNVQEMRLKNSAARFHLKVQYAWLGAITAGFLAIGKKLLGL